MDASGIAIQLSLLLVALGGHIKQAIDRQKALPEELNRCINEVSATSRIIDLVQKEPAFQHVDAVKMALSSLYGFAEMLDKQVQMMGKKRSTVRGVSHQFMHGTAEQQSLSKVIDLLARGKQNLEVQIQLVHVGLTRETRDAIAINTLLVQKVDSSVRDALGSERSLAIAAFVQAKSKEQHPNARGILQLPLDQLEELETEGVKLSGTDTAAQAETKAKIRTITNNLSTGDAFQLNAPFGEDLWEDVDVVKIDGCFASGRSIQSNYIQSGATLDKLLRAREASFSNQQAR